jgi:hypothetical protein
LRLLLSARAETGALAATALVFAVLSLVDVMLLAGMIRHQTAACAHTGADHRALRATD